MEKIDIDSLSEDELIELNHKVVARLRFLHQMRSHSAMLDFRIGERVKFHPSPDFSPRLSKGFCFEVEKGRHLRHNCVVET